MIHSKVFSYILCVFAFTLGQLVTPQFDGSQYTLTVANVVLKVNPNLGGRISSLTLEDEEILYLDRSNGNVNWGSTLWPSPQSWGWPPPSALDNQLYTGSILDNAILLRSSLDNTTGLIFEKRFTGNISDTSISIQYSMINGRQNSIQHAPWEITRVLPGGITFYPQGQGLPTGALAPLSNTIINYTWFVYDSNTIPGGVPKLISDGAQGWLAHVSNTRVFLLKIFKDIPAASQAPGEGEIEIYTNPEKTYQEVEQQGPFTDLDAGDSLSWQVQWKLRRLPSQISDSVSNPDLIQFAQSLAEKNISSLNKTHPYSNAKITHYSNSIGFSHPISGKLQLEIFDIQGRLLQIKTQVLHQSKVVPLPLAGFFEGFYLIKLSLNEKIWERLILHTP